MDPKCLVLVRRIDDIGELDDEKVRTAFKKFGLGKIVKF